MRDEEFDRLYREHAQGLYAFLMYRTNDEHRAEDLMADAFERALRARRRFDPRRASAKTWLYAIALNALRDDARRRGTEQSHLARLPEVPEEHDPIDAMERRELLMRGLDGLPEPEREAVALRFGADLTIPEIARVLGERRSTVHGRVYRGLARLREDLGPPEG